MCNIKVPYYCDNLICGEPLIFMDWGMLQQFFFNTVESIALFGAVAVTLEWFVDKGIVRTPR